MNHKIPWYPWLNLHYKKIISFYQNNHKHHALLLHANHGLAGNILIYAIIRWIMCCSVNNIKSCGICRNCRLIISHNHPDLHKITVDNYIGIDEIRFLKQILTQTSQQGNNKIIWFPDANKLTHEAVNALLKTIEEPTANTYFFLKYSSNKTLQNTLRSRCFYYHLTPPQELNILLWLQQQKTQFSLIDMKIAIKLTNAAPLATFNLLQSINWMKRKIFLQLFANCFKNKILLNMLTELNQKNLINKIDWLISILLDTLKYKQNIITHCINQDQLMLIKIISFNHTYAHIFTLMNEWMILRYQLSSINGINQELQLINQLTKWQKMIEH
uniref:DNA polymerase III subunit delta' n=1 Tax=Candidatus Aschnera chinzeii TaxID=1485666 RepID=A0AAT9G3T2_9ENTR|nr:MAG: DNA polymerase III subunit delta' [Candidatus Aschnera chinzeii]